MSYPIFLIQWYNWVYLAALVLAALSFTRLQVIEGAGEWVARRLGIASVSGRPMLRVLTVACGVVGLTVNGALHDYYPAGQERGFVPGLLFTLLVAVWTTRWAGRQLERHFPTIRAVGWGATDLAGREARVVSRKVSRDYRAGRAQVMDEDGTLHMVLCKTREVELSYGALVVLTEYDETDRRYYVEEVEGAGGGVQLHPQG